MIRSTARVLGPILALLLAGCASTGSVGPSDPLTSSGSTPGASMTGVEPSLTVTSSDFVDGGALDARFSANAWGQCSGENLNPALSWEGAPDGTVSFAITMRDLSAGNWSHWVHVNIPREVTRVETGAGESLPGVTGRNAASLTGYFGPCPPSQTHRYEFTVWALDAMLDLPEVPSFPDFFLAARDHILAQGSIIGLYSPEN